MEQPEAMRSPAGTGSSPSAGRPTAKPSSGSRTLSAVPTVPDYELLRRIGGGAYGEVWLARSVATGALRAAKIVWRHKFEDDRPFRREFEGIQRFEQISREHPSQLALFHIGRNDPDGYFYYVMELADSLENPPSEIREPRQTRSPKSKPRDVAAANRLAESDLSSGSETGVGDLYTAHTLRAELEGGRLPAGRVLEIGRALAEALSHLHRNGLVHRDVKPSNVIFVKGRPKLADIGLVTDASDQCSIVGTEGYLPPAGPGTPQADIFALGKVLYEAATGLDRREFPKLPEDLRSWSDARDVFELNEIILKACATDPGLRYKTAEAMFGELALLHGGKSIRRKRTLQWWWPVGKKAAIALGVTAAVAALISSWPRQASRSEPSSDGPDSTNLEANALCDKGMYILRGDDYGAVGAAYTNFLKAIALDPNFARPYVGLLELGVREDVHVPGLSKPTTDDLRSIARHLERLAPHLAATHVAESVIAWSDGNFPGAERQIQDAIQANPNYELAHTFYGWLLSCYGRPEKALSEMEIARKLAPSKVIIYRAFGNVYYALRDYTNAIAWYRKAIEWEPHHYIAWYGVATSMAAMGDYTNALGYLETNQILLGADEATAKQGTVLLRRALDRGGIPGFWQQQRKWAENNTNENFYWKAVIQIHLGNTNAALDLLEKSREIHEQEQGSGYETELNTLLYYDFWDGLHDNPRFKKLLDEAGFTTVMTPRKR